MARGQRPNRSALPSVPEATAFSTAAKGGAAMHMNIATVSERAGVLRSQQAHAERLCAGYSVELLAVAHAQISRFGAVEYVAKSGLRG